MRRIPSAPSRGGRRAGAAARALSTWLAWLAGPAGLLAAVPGLPEPPVPDPAPVSWVDTGNDNLSDSVLNRDDYRTGTLDAGLLGRHVAAAINESVLTSRQAQTRNDQMTGTLGWVAAARESPSWLSLGVGLRGWGDFGGDHLQNELHRHAGYRPLGYAYDRDHRVDELIDACGRWTWMADTPEAMSWVAPPGRWGLSLSAGGLGTTGGDWEGEVEGDLIYGGRQGEVWIGTRLHDEVGRIPGSTAQAVAWRERGWWLMAGTAVEPAPLLGVLATAGLDPGTHGAFGSVGVVVHQAPRGAPRQRSAVEQDIGYFSGAVVGAQYRWTPLALGAPLPGPAGRLILAEVALDYRFGGVKGLEFRDDEALSDQLTIGPAFTLQLPPIAGLVALRPYAALLNGVRVEHIAPQDGNAEFAEAEAASGVTQLSVGLRLWLQLPPTRTAHAVLDHLRLGGGYDRWFPWRSAAVVNGADRQEYLRTQYGWGGYLGSRLDW